MNTCRVIIVIASFRLRPEDAEQWLEAWRGVAAHAKRREGCRLFRLFRAPDDETHYAVISEWDSRSAFNAFARDTGLIWMEEALASSCVLLQYTIFELASDEPTSSPLETPDQIVIPA